jgi:hypothetical protein
MIFSRINKDDKKGAGTDSPTPNWALGEHFLS